MGWTDECRALADGTNHVSRERRPRRRANRRCQEDATTVVSSSRASETCTRGAREVSAHSLAKSDTVLDVLMSVQIGPLAEISVVGEVLTRTFHARVI